MNLIQLIQLLYFRYIYLDIEKIISEINTHNIKTKTGKIKDINIESLEFDKSINEHYEELKDFYKVIKQNFNKNITKNFIEKIKRLKIRNITYKKEYSRSLYKSLGYYDSKNNVITMENYEKYPVDEETRRKTLNHEILHMLSSKITSFGPVSGFEIPDVIGLNLNEGYTEYLNKKYFTDEDYAYYENDYILFAKGIENIVGKDKMEELYFNANIAGLINELSKYASRKEVIELLYSIDVHNAFLNRRAAYEIMLKIIRIQKNKLDKEFKKGMLTEREYMIKKAVYIDEYRKGNIFRDELKIIEDNDSFIIKDGDFESPVYFKRKINVREKKKKVLNLFKKYTI